MFDTAFSAFGLGGNVTNGQQTDLGNAGDTGFAKARLQAFDFSSLGVVDVIGSGSALTQIIVSRTFSLSNTANFWDVRFGGILRGLLVDDLSTGGVVVGASMRVISGAYSGFGALGQGPVSKLNEPGALSLSFGNTGLTSEGRLTVNASVKDDGWVAPGTYTFVANLSVKANFDQTFGPGFNYGDFGSFTHLPANLKSVNGGLTIALDADPIFVPPQPVPVPEPSTIVVALEAAVGFVALCFWRRQSPA